ncbi:MBOAT family O-acyltransferase [Hoeflea sp.]|uniref:MBOAT family O-acyltransferase n=1 Tax=Hoeflea sp. TaxID=1940281 RepID=UPI0019B5514B|nr:MBOAT family O-acyltransferase [Hoeflea sp.]MBC7281387.1 MBOAT family protein [Hoeflea sp.]
MLFSSNLFLFVFLPLFLICYFAVRSIVLRNIVLLGFSLLFYAWGEPYFVWIMLGVIVVNWACVPALARGSRLALAGVVTFDLGVLVVAKYTDFVIVNINLLTGSAIAQTGIALPLGVSFFCFQAISFAVDTWRGAAAPERRLVNVALYIAMFPQLVAGPIVRFSTVARHLDHRIHTLMRASLGARIFMLGMAQKVLIANEVGRAADVAFSLGPSLDTGEAWIGLSAYTLQIYYDFAGYSNMAIGLGLICGFMFPRNFRLPYTARSVTEFWRRWHISLSRWFRDYVYIPLGGNRRGGARTGFNLMAVFLLCGLWHGAALGFLVWGLHHGLFLLFERYWYGKRLAGWPPYLRQAYCLLAVMAGWVWFRAESLPEALQYFTALGGAVGDGAFDAEMTRAIIPYWYVAFGVGAVLAIVPAHVWRRAWNRPVARISGLINSDRIGAASIVLFIDGTMALILFSLSIILLGGGAYNPFLYFRF